MGSATTLPSDNDHHQDYCDYHNYRDGDCYDDDDDDGDDDDILMMMIINSEVSGLGLVAPSHSFNVWTRMQLFAII